MAAFAARRNFPTPPHSSSSRGRTPPPAPRTRVFARVAAETAGWIMREMQSPEGGYYSSLDADSEHEEGKFYVWTPGKVSLRTTAEEYAVVAAHYGLDRPANFEG